MSRWNGRPARCRTAAAASPAGQDRDGTLPTRTGLARIPRALARLAHAPGVDSH
ncbi:hypothetical protein ABZ922_45015 [Streptomyces shenzhenensis]|uniref:hypothetical protein n=1 Tax=Streptomyces shenzhenensis TaxID=943815 RepID=UPI0033F1B217